tara:strand:- start:349 stop:561 length:213 start_codon:yes stop_codon:yes gene_type:complete
MYKSPFENPDYCEKVVKELEAKGIVRKLKSGEEPSPMQKEFKELCDAFGGVDKLLSILQVAADIEEGSDV